MAGRPHPLDALIDPGARLERLATGFAFVEGPVWHPDGHLLFTDIPADRILRWDEAHGARVEREPSGRANGLALEPDGSLLACEHVTSTVTRTRSDGTREVVAARWRGRELNSPNDLIVAPDGAIWFTDPHPAGRTAAWGVERPRELDFQGVFRVPPGGGEPELVADDFRFPNGLCLAPDGRTLYVNDTLAMHVRAYPLGADGAVGEARVLHRLGGEVQLLDGRIVPADVDSLGFDHGFPDGMKCDERGNVWCTGPGGVWVIAPDGTHVGTVELPELAANLAWGGADGRTLFVTATSSVYGLETLVRGARPAG
ncbi:MAG: SMP-30/gluconolactonase/LRE family protein [Thermoleophilia bacterium]